MIEESISRAYVKLIRTAERFIYVENQYFLGSAYAWHTDSEVGPDLKFFATAATVGCVKYFPAV